MLLHRPGKLGTATTLHIESGGTNWNPDSIVASQRLQIYDRETNRTYLIDSGSDVSCIPVPLEARKTRAEPFELYAANQSKIKTFGRKLLTLSLGFRRTFKWHFVVAQVSTAIIGADFLTHFGLLVDLRHQRLIDSTTNISMTGKCRPSSQQAVKLIADHSRYHTLLRRYPSITNPTPTFDGVKHSIVHYIETKGPPISARPRRLHPKVLAEVIKEFHLQLTITN